MLLKVGILAGLKRPIRKPFACSTSTRRKVIPLWSVNAAILAVVTFMTSACSVMQPHVDVPPAPADYNLPVVFAGGLDPQIARAWLLQQRYMDAVSDESLLTNSLAITAIPAAAAALAVGITNPGTTSTRNVLTGVGVGVATLLGVGSFLVDRRRDAIYYQGAKEIYCLTLAISPLAIEESEFQKMWQDVEQLRLNLAEAAAAGVQATLIDQGNDVFASARNLVRDTAQAGIIFSNELQKINIAVNAQIASEEHNIGDIATAISVIQKTPLNAPGGAPTGTTQGGRAGTRLSTVGAEARLRSSIEAVTAWLAAYNKRVTVTAGKLQAAQCLPTTAASPLQAQPIVIVTNGQKVTVTPAGQDSTGGSGSVITLQTPPSPPRIRPRVPSTEPSPSEMRTLRQFFKLQSTEATFSTSPAFREKVKEFQRCRGEQESGVLTAAQKKDALDGLVCMPLPGSAPGGGPPPSPGQH